MSSLMKGLLRLVVRVRMPGGLAPWLSMNVPSSSLQQTHTVLLLGDLVKREKIFYLGGKKI